MDMCQNIILAGFKCEHPGHTYYLSPANIYGLDIHDALNNICLVYTWNEFERTNGMNTISSWLLCCFNDKGWYYQSYYKNHKMTGIDIIADNCGGQNKINEMIRFLNIINEGELFGTAT